VAPQTVNPNETGWKDVPFDPNEGGWEDVTPAGASQTGLPPWAKKLAPPPTLPSGEISPPTPPSPTEPYIPSTSLLGGLARGASHYFTQGYDTAVENAKKAQQHISQGNYPGAFHDIASPFLDLFNQPQQLIHAKMAGQLSPEQSGQIGQEQVLGLAGIDPRAFQARDYPVIAGNVLSAAAMMAGGHALSSRLTPESPLFTGDISDARNVTPIRPPRLRLGGEVESNIIDVPETPAPTPPPPTGRPSNLTPMSPRDVARELYPGRFNAESDVPVRTVDEALDALHQIVPQQHGPWQDVDEPFEMPASSSLEDIQAQEMRVPNTRSKQSGLPNLAMGGASPKVLQALGTNMYSGEPEQVVIKELAQNAQDEHGEIGQTKPVRVLFDNEDTIPQTQGEKGKSLQIRDFGRGMTPDQLYTKFSDLGETGKEDLEAARGGFGFAKAAPFLSGRYMSVTSVVNESGKKVAYSFSGTPEEFKNQSQGVGMHRDVVNANTPTGTNVKVYFNEDADMYHAKQYLRNSVIESSNNPSPIEMLTRYGDDQTDYQNWINGEDNYLKGVHETLNSSPPLPEQGRISVPGADISFHWDPTQVGEYSDSDLVIQNKGLFQAKQYQGYGGPVPNVPKKIVANIVATVKEGQPGYPFTTNREQISKEVTKGIMNWIKDNVSSGAKKEAIARLQRLYDNISPLGSSEHNLDYFDDGARFTPDEIKILQQSPAFNRAMQGIQVAHKILLHTADQLNWQWQGSFGGPTAPAGWKPSDRLKKFGILFQAPGADSTLLGIHIPRADDISNSAILINFFEHVADALNQNPDYSNSELASSLFTTMAHEIAHIPGGGHDVGHSYRDAKLHSKIGTHQTVAILEALMDSFGDPQNGEQLSPELQNLLSVYESSRQRTSSLPNDLLKTGINSQRPSAFGQRASGGVGGSNTGQTGPQFVGSGFSKGAKPKPPEEVNVLEKIMLSSRAAKIQGDISYALRQAKPFVFSSSYWKGVNAMRQMAKNDINVYNALDNKLIFNDPWYKLGQQVGLYLPDLEDNRPENIGKIKFLENLPVIGKSYFQRTNMMNVMMLRVVRQKEFSQLMDAARDMNLDLNDAAKRFAYDVNTQSGQADLNFKSPRFTFRGKEYNADIKAEGGRQWANYLMFAPSFAASRLKMLAMYGKALAPLPDSWVGMNKIQRTSILRNLFALTSLAIGYKILAGRAGNEQEESPVSSDFLKTKVGDTRFETLVGMQKYIVLAARLLTGKEKSSSTGETYTLGGKFGYQDIPDVLYRFAENMANPYISKGLQVARSLHGPLYDPQTWSEAKSYGKPFKLGLGGEEGDPMWQRIARTPFENELMNLYTPMFAQDTYDVLKSNPNWANLVLGPVGSLLGEGVQTYESDPYRQQ
jgi:hypothetical protein